MGLSRGLNKVLLLGNVGKDPEVKTFENGTKIAKFSLATTEVYKKNNEKQSTTEWHNVIVFKNLADIAENYVKKGDSLYVEGKIQTRSYEDKNGVKKFITEIIGNSILMISSSEGTQSSKEEPKNDTPDEGDDLPF